MKFGFLFFCFILPFILGVTTAFSEVEAGKYPMSFASFGYLVSPRHHQVKAILDDLETLTIATKIGAGEAGNLKINVKDMPEYIAGVEKKHLTQKIMSIPILGLAATGAGLAVYFKLQADGDYDKYKKATSQEDINRYWDHTWSNRDNAFISLGVAGVGIITAAILWFVRPEIPNENPEEGITEENPRSGGQRSESQEKQIVLFPYSGGLIGFSF
ncbi:MAG: hypothetical protein PHE84_12995 [bacterium]|nr:hypothetical protein [bacterium]